MGGVSNHGGSKGLHHGIASWFETALRASSP